ncbi:hypothetical protein FRC19_005836 [Serendipita sp. 401]|nr:hypothetical protein FRC19_005836 [Serendipita sp. 401]
MVAPVPFRSAFNLHLVTMRSLQIFGSMETIPRRLASVSLQATRSTRTFTTISVRKHCISRGTIALSSKLVSGHLPLLRDLLGIDRSLFQNADGNETEAGKLRLWKTKKGNDYVRQSLNLTIVVDNSVVEVYANDVTVITTRVYPWLSASKGAGFFTNGGGSNSSVYFSNLEVWDGLINAWPRRPADTRKPLLWDGPLPNSAWSSWSGV